MFFLIFFILLPIWLIFSGIFDAFHISMGVLSCAIVAFISKDLYKSRDGKNLPISSQIKIFFKLLLYFPWILLEVIKANIDVAKIVISKNIKESIDPEIITYKTRLKGNLAKTLFANSITLTPGTVTMSLLEDELKIHAIQSNGAVDGIIRIEDKLLKIFGEEN